MGGIVAIIERTTISGPSGALEAVVEDPGTAGNRYALLCHPHPLYGGTMDNKVVTTLGKALRDAGIPTLRFNYRGVGNSEGAFDSGNGETLDATAVADWGSVRWPGRQLIIAGFSFGSYVALRLAQQRQASFLIAIAPPVERFDFISMPAPACPCLVVQGDTDDVVNPQKVAGWVKRLIPQPQLVVLSGAGHFFHGRLHELRAAVNDAIRSG